MRVFKVCPATNIPLGQARRVVANGAALCIYHLPEGYFATDDRCTHGGVSLADGYIDGTRIVCPRHSGAFHIPTGQAVRGPCVDALRTYAVRCDDNWIEVHLGSSTAP